MSDKRNNKNIDQIEHSEIRSIPNSQANVPMPEVKPPKKEEDKED